MSCRDVQISSRLDAASGDAASRIEAMEAAHSETGSERIAACFFVVGFLLSRGQVGKCVFFVVPAARNQGIGGESNRDPL